jgi:uncharacterized protein GlcG (DUF336 family)
MPLSATRSDVAATRELSLDVARAIVVGARRFALESGFRPVTIVVLDPGGYLVVAEREDGSPNKQFEIAHAKAHGSLSVGIGSRALVGLAQADPVFFGGVAAALGSPLLASPGGVLVRDAQGSLVGAVGVSGETGDNDERLAVRAIEGVGLVPQID